MPGKKPISDSNTALNHLKQVQKPNQQMQKKHDHIPKTAMNGGIFSNSQTTALAVPSNRHMTVTYFYVH